MYFGMLVGTGMDVLYRFVRGIKLTLDKY